MLSSVIILSMRKGRLLLLSILILGLGLRLYRLSWPILIDDELSSVLWWMDLNFLGKLIRSATIEPSPPLYFILLHSWIKLFGATELSIRFLSVLLGLFSLIVVYLVGKELINTRTGITAALIMAISPYHIYHTTYGRMYALLLWLTLLSIYFFIKLLKEGGSRWRWGYIFSTTLCLYTHFISLYIILIENIYFFIFRKEYKRLILPWIKVQGIVVLFFLPWFPVFLKNLFFSEWALKTIGALPLPDRIQTISYIFINHFMPYLSPMYFTHTLEDLSRSNLLRFFLEPYNLFPIINFLMSLTFSLFFISGIWSLRRDKRKLIFLSLYLFSLLIFLFFVPRYNKLRFFIQVSPAFYLIIAAGILAYRNKCKIISLGLVFIFYLLALHAYYAQIKPSPIKEAFTYLKDSYQSGDLILINSYDIRNWGTNFWYRNRFQNNNAFSIRLLLHPSKTRLLPSPQPQLIIRENEGRTKTYFKQIINKLIKASRYQNVEDIYESISLDELKEKNRIWYVGDENRSFLENNKEAITLLENDSFSVISYTDWGNIRLYLLQKIK